MRSVVEEVESFFSRRGDEVVFLEYHGRRGVWWETTLKVTVRDLRFVLDPNTEIRGVDPLTGSPARAILDNTRTRSDLEREGIVIVFVFGVFRAEEDDMPVARRAGGGAEEAGHLVATRCKKSSGR